MKNIITTNDIMNFVKDKYNYYKFKKSIKKYSSFKKKEYNEKFGSSFEKFMNELFYGRGVGRK